MMKCARCKKIDMLTDEWEKIENPNGGEWLCAGHDPFYGNTLLYWGICPDCRMKTQSSHGNVPVDVEITSFEFDTGQTTGKVIFDKPVIISYGDTLVLNITCSVGKD